MKKLSIVILNWNGEELLQRYLPSVIKHSPKEWTDIIVADNGSTDNSIKIIQEKFPTVQLILLKQNYGFAEGYNRALEEIETEYVVLLNSDVEVTPQWIDAPLELLDKDKNVAAVQPKILSDRHRNSFEYAGAAGGYLDKYGYPFCRGRILHKIEEDRGQYDKQRDILWGSGACLFIRTKIYKEAGGLDKNFFAHQEEIDLCWRLRSRGFKLVCVPQSVIYHKGAATLHKENPHKTFLNFRNNLLLLYKNLPENEIKTVMRVRFWLDYLAAIKFLLTGNFQNAKAVYKARKDFFAFKKHYFSIRQENLTKNISPNIPEKYNTSILVAFYLKGKRTFDKI